MRRKIVFFAESVTLAHIARPFTLASGLDPAEFEVTFAWHPRYRNLFPVFPFTERKIQSIESAEFLKTLDTGGPSYDVKTLIKYVEEDLVVLDEVRPDIVVGDFRLSLSVSARLRKIPYVNITNAYWSPYADIRIPAPDLWPFRALPTAVAQGLFDLIRPLAFARNAGPMRALHRHFGLRPPPPDVRAAYTLADFVAYADVSDLVPVRGLPGSHKFIGPILWAPRVSKPDWWAEVSARPGLKAYVTLGSSGASVILPKVIAALSETSFTRLIATAGHRVPPTVGSKNIFYADYLPGDEAAAASSIVICNGGSPSSYQALSQGTPILGLCTNFDQQLNMTTVASRGAGISVIRSDCTADKISNRVHRILDGSGFKSQAEKCKTELAAFPPAPKNFVHWLSDIL